MNRKIRFEPGEWYHCYNRGVDKRKIFMKEHDYERFLMLMYACNSSKAIHISDIDQSSTRGPTLSRVMESELGKPIVDIGAYCLMGNHPHLLMQERVTGGITSFMRKLGTGYTMYFNLKYHRTGALFEGTFKAKHVPNDSYLERAIHYIHANPAELIEPKWKEGIISNESALRRFLDAYRYSSLPEYSGKRRLESKIINTKPILDILDRKPSINEMLSQARDFYSRSHLG